MLFKKEQEKIETDVGERTNPATTISAAPSVEPVQPESSQGTSECGILESIIKAAPIFQQLIPLDVTIGVTDREKFLYNLKGRNNTLADPTGMPIPKGDAIYEAIHAGKIVRMEVPKEVFGLPIKATGVPVKDERGNIVGGAGMAVDLESQEKLLNTSRMVVTSSQQIAATAEELASSAEQLAKHQASLHLLAEGLLEQVNQTDAILGFINDVAATSNLLGLNAAIEAARAGEHGRGFSVVADEIRKMSVNSANSVKEIRDILVTIKDKITLMSEKITDTSAIVQEQAAATQEISAAIQELASSANKIEEVAYII